MPACHALICELLERLAEKHRDQERLEHQIQHLLRRLYGRSSERLDDEDMVLFRDLMDQLVPKPAPAPASTPEPVAAPTSKDSNAGRHQHGRERIPGSLPRQEIIHDLSEEEKRCPGCGRIRCMIGREISEQYDYVPPKVTVLQHVQLKYACKACDQDARGARITLSQKPLAPVEKGLAAPGLLAHVVVSKYGDHLPMYRMESILERSGLRLSRSTLCDWAAQTAAALKPLYERMHDRLLESAVIHTDDTPVDALEPKTGGRHTGRFWVYVGDAQNPYCLFDYTASRSRDGPMAFLGDWSGYLQADAFSGYDGIYLGRTGGRVVEVACWAHARRKFYDARTTDPPTSTRALAYIRLLYDVEDQIRQGELDAPERASRRQAQAQPRLTEFKEWLGRLGRENGGHVMPKSPMGEAVGYALNQWDALNVYLTDGRLSIDNNVAENALRRVALGRKNWLFVGSDNGGRTAAVLYSLISSCKRHKVEPWTYLRDVLTRIPLISTQGQLDDLLPDRWQTLREKEKENKKTERAAP